eukprot:5838555-Pleurochrysis_carterae.AAC.1
MRGLSPAIPARVAGGVCLARRACMLQRPPIRGGAEGLDIPSCSASRLSRAMGLGGFAGLRGGMTPSQPG